MVTIKADAQIPTGRDDSNAVVFVQESSRAQLIDLAALVDEGHLKPQVGGVYPLARAAEAYSAKAAGGIPRQDRPPALIHDLPGPASIETREGAGLTPRRRERGATRASY